MEQQQKILTFWDHLEELRHVLFRIAVAVVFLMLVAFLFKDELFAIVLAPKNADFIIYRFFCHLITLSNSDYPSISLTRQHFQEALHSQHHLSEHS